MTQGSVSKVVATFGSTWGRIQLAAESREVFFNHASLAEGVDFASIKVGQLVDFVELKDHVNGSHAEQLIVP